MILEEIIKKNPSSVTAKAYKFAKQAHEGQKRKTGEPYFNHAVAVAEQLFNWRLDEATVAAGLLHDVLEDTPIKEAEMEKEFGEEITFLVESVSKLGKVKYRGVEAQAEKLRKLILALSRDVRVVLIKLADRLHNMRTLAALPPQKQRRIAVETADIYAPLAYRLGMHNISGELEDLAFPFIEPMEYEKLIKKVGKIYGERERYLEKVKPIIEEELKKSGVRFKKILFRAKRYFSLHKKLLRHEMDVEAIYDLVAFRIIVERVEDCYAALGIVHSLWRPLPNRIKDYIALPKPNGYQSLHTTVFCLDNKIVEFQIRTEGMDEEAENGAAAHWIYKQLSKGNGVQRKDVSHFTEESKWIAQLKNWSKDFNDDSEFLQAVKVDLQRDRIYAISPKGDVYDLPDGATPIDYAYHVHSDLGNEATGAKINEIMIPLSGRLRSGDVVEILRQRGKKPSADWLKFVRTRSAKEHIREVLNKKKRIK